MELACVSHLSKPTCAAEINISAISPENDKCQYVPLFCIAEITRCLIRLSTGNLRGGISTVG